VPINPETIRIQFRDIELIPKPVPYLELLKGALQRLRAGRLRRLSHRSARWAIGM